MIPVSLTIKGLYSYQQETTIDFTNLTSAGLFGIFGAVGSGKSTILEAITFALYGETERLNSRDGRSYNMMNLKCNDTFIDFQFLSGNPENKYRFTVNCRRNKKKFSDAGSFDRKTYQWQQNNWQPIQSEATEILGLSYDNFKRTIIIPQGKFQEFLQLKDSERVQMLKEIFSLEKFELSPKVARLVNENNLTVSNMEGQMQSLPEYDEVLLTEKEKQITILANETEAQAKELLKKQEEEQALQLLKILFEDVKQKTALFTLLKTKEPAIDELDKSVKEFEKCVQLFKYPFETINKLAEVILNQEAEVKKLLAEKKRIENVITIEREKVEKLKESYEAREILLKEAAELEKIITIKALIEEIQKLNKRIEDGEKLIKADDKKLEELKTKSSVIKADINKAEQELPDTAQLIALNNWFNDKKQKEENKTRLQQESERLLKKLQNIKGGIELKLKDLPQEIQFKEFPGSLKEVNNKAEQVNRHFDTIIVKSNEELSHLQLTERLGEFAKSLKPDEECPLCGSVHHPDIHSAENVSEEIKQKQTEIEDIQKKKTAIQKALIALSGAYSDYATFTNQYNQKQQESEKSDTEINNFIKSFDFKEYTINDEVLVQTQLINVEKKTNQIKKLRTELDSVEKESENLSKSIQKYKDGVDSLKNQNAVKAGELNTLQSQVILYNVTTEINKKNTELTSHIDTLIAQHKQLTTGFEKAQKTLHENNNQLAGLAGRMEELDKQLAANMQQKNELNQEIRLLLSEAGYASEKEVVAILGSKLNIKSEKEKVEAYRRELHAAAIQLADAQAKVEGKEYNAAMHALLKEEIAKLTDEVKDKSEKVITERNDLRQLKQQMETRRQLQKDLDKLMLRAENLKVLSNLFRGSGFVNYVSSVYLQNLINSANQRFYKMTRQKLMLELAEDNSFKVRDFMNNGEVRSVKTLSGGQTFQAALSLALALADNIQHLTKSKQNFFFLDEGFGSLDKEALAIVFETLKSLLKENRIVGVISHVEEMQHEIQVNLKIVNDIEKGSLVTNSWS